MAMHQTRSKTRANATGPSSGRVSVTVTGEEVTRRDQVQQHEAPSPSPTGRLGVEEGYCQLRPVNLRPKTRVGTWKVQTLNTPGKLINVVNEMKRCKISILGIAETHWTGSGYFKTDDGQMIVYSGGYERRAGVGVILAKELANNLLAYEAVNKRVVRVRIAAKPYNITFIQVYAPTADSDEDEIEAFYNAVQVTINNSPSQDIMLVGGDFNAKVGEHETESAVCGRYGLGVQNLAVERVIDFAVKIT